MRKPLLDPGTGQPLAGLYYEGGVLYTDTDHIAAPAAPKRKAHMMAEWKVDWWLGREVKRGPQEWRVVASEPHGAVPMLVLMTGPHTEKVSLTVANAALRKGDWSLL